MSKNGKVTQKHHQDVHNETFVLPDKYESGSKEFKFS